MVNTLEECGAIILKNMLVNMGSIIRNKMENTQKLQTTEQYFMATNQIWDRINSKSQVSSRY
jgi:hypothetical protein